MNKGSVLIGVLAGVAIGVALGVLFAPDKGSETREKLSKGGADSMDDLKDKFNDFLASLVEKFESEKDDVSEQMGKTNS